MKQPRRWGVVYLGIITFSFLMIFSEGAFANDFNSFGQYTSGFNQIIDQIRWSIQDLPLLIRYLFQIVFAIVAIVIGFALFYVSFLICVIIFSVIMSGNKKR